MASAAHTRRLYSRPACDSHECNITSAVGSAPACLPPAHTDGKSARFSTGEEATGTSVGGSRSL